MTRTSAESPTISSASANSSTRWITAQDALLENGKSLQGQLEALTGQITHMIQVLTPERPEQEGPSLADLLARILTQQSGMAALLRQINDALTRLAPAEAAAAHANTPANGAGRA